MFHLNILQSRTLWRITPTAILYARYTFMLNFVIKISKKYLEVIHKIADKTYEARMFPLSPKSIQSLYMQVIY